MARGELSRGLWRAFDSLSRLPRPQCQRPLCTPQIRTQPAAARCFSATPFRAADVTSDEPPVLEKIVAAPEIELEGEEGEGESSKKGSNLLERLRVVPASPSYFSAKPTFNDDFIALNALLRKYATLPTVSLSEAPRVSWKTIFQYRIMTNEPVKTLRYHKMLHVLRRLNQIHPSLMPQEVLDAMKRYKKDIQPKLAQTNFGALDDMGRGKGVGRRKTSSAVAWLVEGEGEILVNGKSLTEYFGRLHHRESSIWALKATQRLDKYNVWALVQGGGITGQAEAMTLAVAKALLVHEPALKPALRRAGCITRDPRKVERKKTGHIKARKMPTWVKR